MDKQRTLKPLCDIRAEIDERADLGGGMLARGMVGKQRKVAK